MLIRSRRGWELPENRATPEGFSLGRRALLAAGLAVPLLPGLARADDKYPPGRPVTPEKAATTYNNYYEFSTDKDLWEDAQALPQDPWSISFAGLVEKEQTLSLAELLRQVQLEDRVYRHRCVEAWSMVVPWTGFAMARLVALARPLGSAKFVAFTTIADKKHMPGLRMPFYPWPYIDSVTMAEATNDLAFIPTGMYGKPLPPQNGGPIRLVVPWKYGFKSAKSLIKITLSEKRPTVFWQSIQPREYGFWANVNPDVPHPRWSQKTERLLGTGEIVPTRIYNGYGQFVAPLYAGVKHQALFM